MIETNCGLAWIYDCVTWWQSIKDRWLHLWTAWQLSWPELRALEGKNHRHDHWWAARKRVCRWGTFVLESWHFQLTRAHCRWGTTTFVRRLKWSRRVRRWCGHKRKWKTKDWVRRRLSSDGKTKLGCCLHILTQILRDSCPSQQV